eukprot:Gregarina_sp_Poly_1__11299@NODE_942_length_5613_cov_183_854850_g668_i0_p2_GENE_NODE_942_length_5613_cov_183_854850_g668_i0NODE_942_length_5613_cov_183_854850_g668_i0_p2_ORF_typecomplete_len478_score69_31Gpi16/PF04113_14/2_6e12_NODE_942_length_5613_cov_183_854850_g668_i025734006
MRERQRSLRNIFWHGVMRGWMLLLLLVGGSCCNRETLQVLQVDSSRGGSTMGLLSLKASVVLEMNPESLTEMMLDPSLQLIKTDSLFLKSFKFRASQGLPHRTPSHFPGEGQTILDVTTFPDALVSDTVETATMIAGYLTAVSGAALSDAPLVLLDDNSATLKLHSQWICGDMLWRLFRILPCRGLSGVASIMSPKEIVHKSSFRSLQLEYSRKRHSSDNETFSVVLEMDLPRIDIVEHMSHFPLCPLADTTTLTWQEDDVLRKTVHLPETSSSSMGEPVIFLDLFDKLNETSFGPAVETKWETVTIVREETFAKEDSVRRSGIWKYTIQNSSPSDQLLEVIDSFDKSLFQPNLVHLVQSATGSSWIEDLRLDHLDKDKTRVRFMAKVAGEDSLVVRLPFIKFIPQWTDYTFLVQGGFKSPGPVARVRNDSGFIHVGFSQWSLLPLVDISAFFNIVAVSSLGYLLVYNRIVKMGRRV